MRIAYVGIDIFANCAMALLDEGHVITHLFTASATSFPAAVTIGDVSRRAGIPVHRSRFTIADKSKLADDGVEALLCAGYPRRLPFGTGDAVRAVNMHPSPLPEGRGPSPFEWAILTGRTQTAVTIHQLVARFDAGPILLQRPLEIGPTETTASLEYRCRDAAASLVAETFRNFDRLWERRTEQGPGTYCRVPRVADRTIDWKLPTEQIDRMLRAFPGGQRYGRIGSGLLVLGDASCWAAEHSHAPGTLVAQSQAGRLLATSDGFALIRSAGGNWELRARRAAWPVVSRARRLLGR